MRQDRAIGVVFQDAMLFNRFSRETLLIGRPDATPADIRRACEMAAVLNFIEAQPEGFETLIGERRTFQHLLAQHGVFAHLVEIQLIPEISETHSNNN